MEGGRMERLVILGIDSGFYYLTHDPQCCQVKENKIG